MPLSNKDVGRVVKEATQKFLHQPTCVADKKNMLTLVQKLERYTDQVQEAADKHGISTDYHVQQWAKDMENWRVRMSLYFDALEHAQYETGAQSCEELRERVIEPLLGGWYPDDYPGIVNPDVRTVPDVAMPYILGNQVVVYRDHQAERVDRLICDLTLCDAQARREMGDYWAGALGLDPGEDECGLTCWLKRGAIGIGVAGALYLTYRGVKWKKRRDALRGKEDAASDAALRRKVQAAASAEGMPV